MSKRRIVLYALGSIGAVFLVLILFGASERAFGAIGFVFAMLFVFAGVAAFYLVDSLRKRRLSS